MKVTKAEVLRRMDKFMEPDIIVKRRGGDIVITGRTVKLQQDLRDAIADLLLAEFEGCTVETNW